jgi:hypothetical protein
MGAFDHIPPLGPDPDDDDLAERGRELVAAAVAETQAPLALRERLETQRERAQPARRRRRIGIAGSLAAIGAAVAAALVISLNGAGGTPSVLATVQLAGGGPTLPAPKVDAGNRNLLDAELDGVPFPEWNAKFRWRATGARRDEIEGRPATTVFYDNPRGARAAYTILGGAAIDPPQGARTVHKNGFELHVLRRGMQQVVVWDRNGHTCVMSAPASVPEERLIALAAWDAGGGVPF